jgi:gamma-glutamylcyclotransferase (GGCT)/AIG2-like uncharacterized protein YtfP
VTPTWSQGLVVAQALGILDGQGLDSLEHSSVAHLHLVIEAIKLAFTDREAHYADPRFMTTPWQELCSDDHIASLAARLRPTALPNERVSGSAGQRVGSTTSIVVTDGAGAVFSVSPSDTIDGGPVVPGLGILCSPRGVQSRLDPAHPNRVRPGGRPVVTPAAVIALTRDPDPSTWAVACPGGDVIVQAMVQAMVNVESFGMTLQQAVEAPRLAAFSFPGGFHPHPDPDRLVLVESRVPSAVRQALRDRGHDVQDWPDFEFDAGLGADGARPGASVGPRAGPRRRGRSPPQRLRHRPLMSAITLFVNGTLMRGLALHGNLQGATFLEEAQTAPAYRLHSIRDEHPGMFRVERDGVSVRGELYDVPPDLLARVEASEPPDLYIDQVELMDGRRVQGVLYPEHLARSHPDISDLADWRRYAEQRQGPAGPGGSG